MTRLQDEHRISRTALWFGTTGSAAAWTLHLLLAYLFAEFGCEAGTDAYVYLGVMLPAWLLIGLSIVMLIAAVGSLICAWTCHRRIDRMKEESLRNLAEREFARWGMMAGGLFTFVIGVQTVPVLFYLQSC